MRSDRFPRGTGPQRTRNPNASRVATLASARRLTVTPKAGGRGSPCGWNTHSFCRPVYSSMSTSLRVCRPVQFSMCLQTQNTKSARPIVSIRGHIKASVACCPRSGILVCSNDGHGALLLSGSWIRHQAASAASFVSEGRNRGRPITDFRYQQTPKSKRLVRLLARSLARSLIRRRGGGWQLCF